MLLPIFVFVPKEGIAMHGSIKFNDLIEGEQYRFFCGEEAREVFGEAPVEFPGGRIEPGFMENHAILATTFGDALVENDSVVLIEALTDAGATVSCAFEGEILDGIFMTPEMCEAFLLPWPESWR